MPRAALLLALGAALGAAPSPAAAGDAAALQQAAGLYHQARYDDARAGLEELMDQEGWRRRDSLMILQYLGMSYSRLGADSAAVSRFGDLLEVDSLFRFPSNEEAGIRRNFQAARKSRAARRAAASAAPAPVPATDPAEPAAQAPAAGTASASPPPLAAAGVPDDPSRARMSLALGAVPLGGGWLIRKRRLHGVSLAMVQAGGILLSVYASGQQDRMREDLHGIEAGRERDLMVRWQWVQGVSLSTAVGAYLFSIFASGGD